MNHSKLYTSHSLFARLLLPKPPSTSSNLYPSIDSRCSFQRAIANHCKVYENAMHDHKMDKDESPDSLRRGLPVVSISICDTAEFLYRHTKDMQKANKVWLKSGDVLIFGGKSRHIFHGVNAIIPNSAPTSLLKETMLRPGRLNLTFRKY